MTLLSVIEAQLDPPNTPLDASLRPGAMENLDAASGLLRRLGARRYHRTVFRLLPISDESHVSMLARSEDVEQSKSLPAIVAELFGNAKSRFDLECSIEDGIGAPRGSVVVHCPPYKGPVKLAEILLLEVRKDGRDQTRSLSRIGELLNGLFLEHEKAVTALHGMYSSMWRLTVSVTAPLHLKHATLSPIIAKSIRDHLVKIHCRYRESLLTIENDPSMERELDVAARRRKPVEPTREAADSPGRSASASSDTRRELDASVQTIAAPHPGRATRSLDGLPTASELELFRSRLSTLFDRYNFGFGERDRISLLKSLQSRAAAMSSGELQLASAELELLCPKDRLVAARLKPKDVESAILAVLLRDRQS
ncbi:MAG: hypothetical protein IT459_21970 [Planctomycetes bacterium]|nr:hypothetical protein [Planctomycetota bacterium]